MTWLLDACVLVRAEDAGRLPDLLRAADHVPCAIVREVYDEVTAPRSTKESVVTRARKSKHLIDASKLTICEIPMLSSAAGRFALFRQGRATGNDAGEAASVALTATDDAFVFVTAEKGAAWLGVREVYPRVTVLPWFLRALVDADALSMEAAVAIGAADRMPPPTWWSGWTSGSRSPAVSAR